MEGLEIVTSTPGITAPVESSARAVRFEVSVWENVVVAIARTVVSARADQRNFFQLINFLHFFL
jgi:hypothetical protein